VPVFDERELSELSRDERLHLIRALVVLDRRDASTDPAVRRRRIVVLISIAACILALGAWIVVLAVTLPPDYRSGGWRGAWVGFDIALLLTFAVTGWAAWRRRQVLIVCLIVLATLLCCDAWFDVALDARTKGFELSLLSAAFVELPLAAIAILGARRLLRLSVAVVRRYEGETGPQPQLHQVRLVGGNAASHLGRLFREPDASEATDALPGQSPDRQFDHQHDGHPR
jgi:hypothetical protein